MWKILNSPFASSQEADKEGSARALPANWYTSPALYELERRAIFSKKWQLLTHNSRLRNAGDWLRFDIANYNILLAKDRQGVLRGFHNVCRHRAFPVVNNGDAGTANIFSCKYHGWSYGLHGRLAKAPGYQDQATFDKTQNGLLPIHVHIDRNGFVWVNLDAKATPDVKWTDDFSGIDAQPRYAAFDFTQYGFDHTWSMEGTYNWKILADNYNECYHCKGTHPDIGALADLQSYRVSTDRGSIIHDPATTEEQRAAGLVVASTYYFPNASTNISPHFFMIQRFVPSSATQSKMEYQVFRNRSSSDEDFEQVNQIYKRIMAEDKALCDAAQRNLAAGAFVAGELHPRMEMGPLYFQKLAREAVVQHFQMEQQVGREVWPAKQDVGRLERVVGDAAFCAGLGGGVKCEVAEGLVW